jgi:uncharacterized protein
MSSAPVVITDAERRVLCERCTVADRALRRMRGLLGRRELPRGEGILLCPTPSIHTWFMRFPIDAVFLDRQLRVMSIRSDLRPWRVALEYRARAVLELAAGEAERRGIRPGVQLQLDAPGVGNGR